MTLISASDVEQFCEIGYFVSDAVFSPEELQPMADEMDRVYAEHLSEVAASGDAQAIEKAQGRRSFSQFHNLSAVAVEFVRKPIYLEACRKLIGEDADLYYNQATTEMPKGHGKIFAWHQDSGYTTCPSTTCPVPCMCIPTILRETRSRSCAAASECIEVMSIFSVFS